jgi:hypothetical protein
MSRRKKALRISLCLACAILVALLLSNVGKLSAPPAPGLGNRGAPPAEDPLHAIAAGYAPFIYHASNPRGARQDIISNIDFDGDLTGNNNWENFDRFRLKPTVYYAALETPTHYFISYHLFHPRDWTPFTVWVNDTHENDGENLQVVVRKGDGLPVMLWTQAHYDSRAYARKDCGIADGAIRVAGDFLAIDGRHAAVFVEAEGHGIYGATDEDSEVAVGSDGAHRFENGSGILFRPARPGEQVEEPESATSGEAAYQLDSITLKLWPGLRDGLLTGDGRLLDGSYSYRDELVSIEEVPRYYDGDRISGPLGRDRGISPFALDFTFERGTLGALFFNPAKRYSDNLKITDPWSLEYINYPFTR